MSHKLGREGCYGFTTGLVQAVRAKLSVHLAARDVDAVSVAGVRIGLLRAWLAASADPDIMVADWLVDGCPLGDSAAIPTSGVFPVVSGPSQAVVKSAEF
eukprot:5690570-Amphidinium_carterae.1